MVKIRVYYDNDRELAEIIRLLSPRMNYCKSHPDEEPRRAYIGIETRDLLVDSENTKGDISDDQ